FANFVTMSSLAAVIVLASKLTFGVLCLSTFVCSSLLGHVRHVFPGYLLLVCRLSRKLLCLRSSYFLPFFRAHSRNAAASTVCGLISLHSMSFSRAQSSASSS